MPTVNAAHEYIETVPIEKGEEINIYKGEEGTIKRSDSNPHPGITDQRSAGMSRWSAPNGMDVTGLVTAVYSNLIYFL